MEIVPISQFRERLSCTEIEVLCRAHALSLCSPRPPVSWTPRAQTWDFGWQASPALWTRVACHARLDTSDARASSSQHWLGWFGDLVMDALALILPIWRPASSAKALVDDILLLSPGISRYCYLWFGQPQLSSNATSGYGFHATASRLSQLVPYRVYIIMCAGFREDLMAGPERGRLRTDCGDLTCSKSDTSRTRGPLAVWRGDGGLQSGALTPNWTRGPSFHTGAIW